METTATDITLDNEESQTQNTDTTQLSDQPEQAQQPEAPTHNPAQQRRRKLVVIGIILVLAGWVTMMLNEWVSLGCTVVGLVVSCIGVRIPPGPRRDLGTTAIVAASVLLLVFALFATILYII